MRSTGSPYRHAKWSIKGATFTSSTGAFNNWRRIHGHGTPIAVEMRADGKAAIQIAMPSYSTFTEATDYEYLRLEITPCDPCGDYGAWLLKVRSEHGPC